MFDCAFIHPTTTYCHGSLMVAPPHSFCGSYVGHGTVFRIADCSPEVEFRCSSRSSAQPFRASYSSYNISQRKHRMTHCSVQRGKMNAGVSLYLTVDVS